ncbi:hypothetical protein R1flu_026189 [Riccia fluitans]|uniref:Uncharacterized protein n=1 Tax=Riccia fluitans TaxID=41844 RepID=A0ABD1XI88_9MARC
MAERNHELFGVLANSEQHYEVFVMGTPLPDSDSDVDCSIGLSQVLSSQQGTHNGFYHAGPMSQQWGVSPPLHQVQSMGIPAVPRFNGFQWAPMRSMLAFMFPAGSTFDRPTVNLTPTANLTPMFGIPTAATSPSADSTRAESVDVEDGGEATLDGNGGAGSQGARRTFETKLKKLQAGLAAHGCNAETSQIRWKWDSLLMKYKSMKAYMKRTRVAPFVTLTKAERKEEEIDITERDEPGPSTHRTNSGRKRKSASKSTQVISNCLGKFSGTLLEVESRREDRENRRMQILDEVESKWIALDERRVAVEESRIEIEDKRVSEES